MIQKVLTMLNESGFEAYVVGGAVRNELLGIKPSDYDICSSATPEETLVVFKDYRCLTQGLKHGTVTVIMDHQPIEITTFRTESDYTDHRHPEKVEFTRDLLGDISRRDFTINGLVVSKEGNILDLCEGRNDLENHLIRCIGNPNKRFEEDALRILRALRFASTYDFEIEEQTKKAIFEKAYLLEYISKERITSEFENLLDGIAVEKILKEYKEVLSICLNQRKIRLIPQIKKEYSRELKMALLLKENDIDSSNLKEMKYPNHFVSQVDRIIQHIDDTIEQEEDICFLLYKTDEKTVENLFVHHKKDIKILKDILKNDVYSLKQLAINGKDLCLKDVRQTGRVLNLLLEKVIKKEVRNDKMDLLKAVKEIEL